MNKPPIIYSKAVTIRDVAEKAGVSISLVSFVLNAKRGPNGEYLCSASRKTAEKIVEAARSLGYRANKAATSLRSGRTDTIGVVVADISNICFGDISRKIENMAFEAGYLTMISSSEDKLERMTNILEKFVQSGVDGVIVVPCAGSEEAINNIKESGIPVVLIDRDLGVDGVGRVLLDNEKAGRIAARSLIERGSKHIVMVRYETSVATTLDKEKGYALELCEHGFEPRVEILSRASMDKDMVSVLKLCKYEGADALIFPSNTLTVSGVSAINRLHYKIPEDFEVVGFDQENVSGVYTPGISFVDQPTNLVAEYSFNMLRAAISDGTALSSIVLNPLFYHA